MKGGLLGILEPDLQPAAGPRVRTCLTLSWLHLLKGWSLLNSRGDSKRSSGKWLKLLDPLIQQSGLQKVINHVGCINWWPYRIERLDEEGPALPSHDFTRQLVRDLLENKRIFVIPEEKDIWFNRLPELKFNRNLHNLSLSIYSPKIRKKHITSPAF